MVLTTYEPINIVAEINRLFDHSHSLKARAESDVSSAATNQWTPAVDIKEVADKFSIHVDLPGVNKKDVAIAMENNILSIKGKRSAEKTVEKHNYSRLERSIGSFYRQFTLPDNVSTQNIDANMKDGVLEISIPKVEHEQSRLININ